LKVQIFIKLLSNQTKRE